MTNSLAIPGDSLEGRGALLQHGRLIAHVDYHLTIPHQTHFFINPMGNFQVNYEDYAGGFILLAPADADKLSLTDYTLELANKSKKTVRVERRYKNINHKGEPRISFWVKVVA
jgi:hypothetical protein